MLYKERNVVSSHFVIKNNVF